MNLYRPFYSLTAFFSVLRECITGNALFANNARVAGLVVLVFILYGCTFHALDLHKEHAEEPPGAELPVSEARWVIPDGPEQHLRTRTWNLRHQKLRVRFDFENEQVAGHTELLFESKQTQNRVILDAKTMEFMSVYNAFSGQQLAYEQDSSTVTIELGAWYERGDTMAVALEFISSPPNRGLYFVNARGEDPDVPTQVWTLGQPEDNSFWFPTIDHPAERTTQETWISVPPRFTTLSNGLLMESAMEPGDSLRTDYWRLHQPHAPYLFVLAAGEYDVTEEYKDGILYRYFTEPEFTPYVQQIYKNTTDMIRFSERKTGVKYPWDPVYAQAPVREFIARGMENTTATLLYDAVQFDHRAAHDLSNQDLLLHEIIHQWIGNLVTAKDWANLPLNEGFANYFESRYRLYNNGFEEYLWKNQNDRRSYFAEAQQYRRPVIFNRYTEPEDMYDRHTYQKSGQILRMLHDYLGDELWWKGVQLWLDRFSFEAVDISDLQKVMEDVSREDLDWFFQQWFLSPGHPYLSVSHNIVGNRARLSVTQIHDTSRQPLFAMYPEVLVVFDDGFVYERLAVEQQHEEFTFLYSRPIKDIIVDPHRVQLAEYMLELDNETLLERTESGELLVRSEALAMLGMEPADASWFTHIMHMALNDPYKGIRQQAFSILSRRANELKASEKIHLLEHVTADQEPDYAVRRQALGMLREYTPDVVHEAELRSLLHTFRNDPSYFVSAEAIRLSGRLFAEEAAEMVGMYAGMPSYQHTIREAVAEALGYSSSHASIDILHMLASKPGDHRYIRLALGRLVQLVDTVTHTHKTSLIELFEHKTEHYSQHQRLAAYQGLANAGSVSSLQLLRNRKRHLQLQDEARYAEELSRLESSIRILEYELQLEPEGMQ